MSSGSANPSVHAGDLRRHILATRCSYSATPVSPLRNNARSYFSFRERPLTPTRTGKSDRQGPHSRGEEDRVPEGKERSREEMSTAANRATPARSVTGQGASTLQKMRETLARSSATELPHDRSHRASRCIRATVCWHDDGRLSRRQASTTPVPSFLRHRGRQGALREPAEATDSRSPQVPTRDLTQQTVRGHLPRKKV